MLRDRSYSMGMAVDTKVSQRGGVTRSSDEATVMVVERRGCVIQLYLAVNQIGRNS